MLPSVSIVVEWENAKLSELGRALQMLRSLAQQAATLRPRLPEPVELILLYDEEAIDSAMIHEALEEAGIRAAGVEARILPVRNLDYYQQKNHGASLASHDIVLFMDSDVVPEADWMTELVDAAARHPSSVVSGNTYLDPSTFLGRSFGLFWFFPLRSAVSGTSPADGFFANSVAFPRTIITARPYQPIGAVRGQCSVLADELRRDGVPLIRALGARASHPAPNGVRHLLRRALCEGHDARTLDRVRGGKQALGSPALQSLYRFARQSARAASRVLRYRRAVNMPLYEMPAAVALAVSYYGLHAAGELISGIAPNVIPTRLRV